MLQLHQKIIYLKSSLNLQRENQEKDLGQRKRLREGLATKNARARTN